MTRKKSDPEPLPLGVKILAVSAWLIGALLVLLSAGALAVLSDVEGMIPFAFLGGLAAVAGVFYIAYGLGLWYTESWGWWIGAILNGLGIVGCLLAESYFGLVINAVILAYLYQQRELFEITF